MKILYKKDSKNKIRIWKIWTEGAKIIQEAGILDGKLVRNEKIAKAKNIGKKNESAPAEQALLEMQSTYKSKLDEGYFDTISSAESEEVVLPMLAKSYDDHKHKIDWNNAYIQPKLDGMRCLAIIKNGQVTLKSRDGKVIENMQHIIEELTGLEDQILDGELYTHGLTFQENMKLIKKYRKGETEKIKYYVYDFIDTNEMFKIRLKKLVTLLSSNNFKNIKSVLTYSVNGRKEILKSVHEKNIENGYEGSIIRHSNKPYGIDKRCDSLLKYKDFHDMDLTIIDIVASEQRPTWGQPIFEINGKTFSAGMKYSHEDRVDFLVNRERYIGKIANVRYFEKTDDGLLRFPVMVGIHTDRT